MKKISKAGKCRVLFIVFLLALLLPNCVEEESTVPAGQGWTGADPPSIPLRQRMMLAERGNLVRNPSFELGRIINVDSNTVSYNITGWHEMGENVTWISEEADSGRNGNVHTGGYAIRIRRDRDGSPSRQGEGIVSDFIRVIPGNYQLSFWIKLKDIRPRLESRGRRLNRSIDVRIEFYDKNRLLLSPANADPYPQQGENRSNKSLAFSDFWNIDAMDWVPANGRSSEDFLTEGDIPDDAKYVKLYFGLRGSGTMWIDDIDFRYSRQNFTSLERTEKYLDTTFNRLDLLVPTPRKASLLEPIQYHQEGRDSIPMPVLIIPKEARIQTRAAAELLKKKLDGIFSGRFGADSMDEIRVLTRLPEDHVRKGALVFRIGMDRPLEGDPGEQAYIVRPDSIHPNLVRLSGSTPTGDFYAASSVVQLLEDSLFIYQQAIIEDFPAIAGRAFLVSPVAAASNAIDYIPFLEEMAMLKMNGAYLDFYRSRNLWKQESRAYFEGLKVLGRENRETRMIALAQMVNPYAHLPESTAADSLGPELRNRWAHSDARSNELFRQHFRAGIDAGATTMVLCTNDYLPFSPEGKYVLYAEKDRDRYISLQEAHLELIRSLDEWGRAINPDMRLEFVPPWYANGSLMASRGQAEQYFGDMNGKLPPGLEILWSGAATQSFDLNYADYFRYRQLAGRELVLFDNSMNRVPEMVEDTVSLKDYAMKLRSLNIFHPYDVRHIDPVLLPDKIGKVLINSPLSSEIMKIRIATAADFLWNPEAYDPDYSLWKVLVSRFGRTASLELYRFSDAYFTCLASMSGLGRLTEQQKYFRMIREHQAVMEEILAKLDQIPSINSELVYELKSLKNSMEATYENELRSVANQISNY